MLWSVSHFSSILFVQAVYLGAQTQVYGVFSISAHLASSISCQTQEDEEHSVVLAESGLSDKFRKT